VTNFRIGGWIFRTRSAKPSLIAWRIRPSRRARVPMRTRYTGTPASEHRNWPPPSAAAALCSITVSVLRPSSAVSARSARSSACLVSSGIRLSDAS